MKNVRNKNQVADLKKRIKILEYHNEGLRKQIDLENANFNRIKVENDKINYYYTVAYNKLKMFDDMVTLFKANKDVQQIAKGLS